MAILRNSSPFLNEKYSHLAHFTPQTTDYRIKGESPSKGRIGSLLTSAFTPFRKAIHNQKIKDAFSSGQIASKLWLCREVENLLCGKKQAHTVWILGGWYGLLSFLLLSRERLNIKAICSYDKDPLCKKTADMINENWVWRQKIFKAKTMDCNDLIYTNTLLADSDSHHLIINTSVEHFHDRKWWDNIPSGKTVALQSCDMKIKDHINCVSSEEEFQQQFPSSKVHYSGKLPFDYPTFSFTRYMLIVEK